MQINQQSKPGSRKLTSRRRILLHTSDIHEILLHEVLLGLSSFDIFLLATKPTAINFSHFLGQCETPNNHFLFSIRFPPFSAAGLLSTRHAIRLPPSQILSCSFLPSSIEPVIFNSQRTYIDEGSQQSPSHQKPLLITLEVPYATIRQSQLAITSKNEWKYGRERK